MGVATPISFRFPRPAGDSCRPDPAPSDARRPPPREGWRPSRHASGQLTVSAVSSTTNDVCSELSSVPVKLIVTVCPASEETLNDFCVYPEALLRLEYVASVVAPAFTVSLSYCVEVVVSAESTCSQKEKVAVQPAGMVTDWLSVSVWVVP